MTTYTTREGSVPARLITHLQTLPAGTCLEPRDIAAALDMPRNNVQPCLLSLVKAGVLVREKEGYRLASAGDNHSADQAQADLQEAWGGAVKPAFPSPPPRAGDPPRKMRTLKQVAQEFHRAHHQPTALATVPTPEPASLRQIGGTHHKQMAVQPWDVVDGWPLEQRIGYYRGNALKYLMRMGSKDQDAQEVAKGRHYIEKLLEVLQEQDVQVAA